MAVKLSAAEVTALAPDAAAAAAGRKLGKPAPWKNLGASERAFWGECQGSAVYQTQVSALDLVAKCTCPSRKFPCKHALGLLFLMAESPGGFATSAEPEWVQGWLSKRDVAQQKKQARAEQTPQKLGNTEAQAKRAGKRHANVLAGVEQLEVWLADLLRRGLGRLPSEGSAPWEEQARRLVDAQAPGLAARLRSIGGRVGIGEVWAQRVLGDLGRLALLAHAYRRVDALPPPLAHDVKRLVGYTLEQSEVVAHGDVVEDEWTVTSSVIEDDERLRSQRSWLVGKASRRKALVLQFAAGPARFAEVLLTGTALRAKLAFWPGAAPERALLLERVSAAEPGHVPPHGSSIAAALDGYADVLALDPFRDRTLFVLEGVAAVPGEVWHLVDGAGQALPLRAREYDVLWALSGGHPLLVAAEWDGFVLEPLAAFSAGRSVSLTLGAAA